ncbi:MAG TPA: serpin family protein [Candidatus Acidoferrales bacterium]|nr:serpin family protein [Candidatus Acidoferrales bacterium]
MKAKFPLLLTTILTATLQTIFAADSDLSQLAAANNTFAFKLLKQLSGEKKDGNVFVSPYSTATALQMAANGAAGQTKKEMLATLETAGLTPATLNEASKAAAALSSTDTNLILTTANALWYRQGAAIKPAYLDDNRKYFASTIKALDFGNAPAAEAEINQWASDQTHGRIDGIANGMITPATDLILANAIYFKGKWEDPFDKKLTKYRPFHPPTGPEKNLPMMSMSKKFTYRQGSGYQAVRLPYMGGNLAMYVFLPDPGSSPAKLLDIMNGDKWQRVTVPGFSIHEGLVVLPKFKLENTLDLNTPLAALGMKTAFTKQADFSAMFSDPHSISEVRQKAFVEVGEEGTEAAAVTMIGVTASAIIMNPAKPFEMIVDRPFLFTIVDAHTEMILFMGVVNEL